MVIKFGELFQENITRKKIKPSDDVVFIGMQDVDENATIKEYSVTKYSELKSGFTYFEKNDVLVAKITPCFENGKGGFADSIPTDIGFGSTEFHILRAADSADPRYIYFQTKRPKLRLALEGEMVGSAGHRRVPFAALQNYELEYRHSKAEQTTIANALSDVDKLIAALETLITKKSAIKTAAMQQLLTGKKRLPGFAKQNTNTEQTAQTTQALQTDKNSDVANSSSSQTAIRPGYKHTELGEIPEDWEVKDLSDLSGSFKTGKLDANAMKLDGDYRFYTCAKKYYWIDEYAFNDEALLVSGNGANVGYVHYYKGKFNAYQRTYVMTDFSADVLYLKVYLEQKLAERIRVEVNSGNTPYITMDTLTDMPIVLPSDKKEQTAIANVLSDMDTELDALQQRLSKTKKIKQGMMQELLTGKTRLV